MQRHGFLLPCSAHPNLGHKVVASMAKAGLLWRVVQQNHDGLLQKAGVPQELVNEIHGSWFDPGNPVVKMTECVRDDLYQDTCLVEEEADLVLVLGSSLAGMNADRIVHACARRAGSKVCQSHLGSVIVSLQRTPHDAESSLRIFATIDAVMSMLTEELQLDIADGVSSNVQHTHDGVPDVFSVPYDIAGKLLDNPSVPRRTLDLRDGAELIVTIGADMGQTALVLGKHQEGHYKIAVRRAEDKGGATSIRYLGKWWIGAAVAGKVPQIPLITA
jgi:hypothetical protein